MLKLNVALEKNSYPIFIGQDLLRDKGVFDAFLSSEVLIITDEEIAKVHLTTLCQTLHLNPDDQLILPTGEEHKNLTTLSHIFDTLMARKFSRKAVLIALGGGIIGDMVSFAAALYQRGIAFIQIPTTLLAQVDSAVGGKTGVNYKNTKNMVGAFYQPKAVIIDLATLSSLPDRQYAAGLAEVIKYGLIWDKDFFEELERGQDKIKARDRVELEKIIYRCCEIKAHIVNLDERENHIRAILNFGHTFGHALEPASHFTLLHGEAIAIGMCLALKLSTRLGLIDESILERAKDWLEVMGLPTQIPAGLSAEAVFEAMEHDKKRSGDTFNFIVLEALGKAVVKSNVPLALVHEILNERT